MSWENFNMILDKIKDYTNYIYLHVMGEPLLHPLINDFIDIASRKGFKVNITTNGFLINRLNSLNVRQLNVSLHDFKEQKQLSKEKYFLNLFQKCDELAANKTYINYRIWRDNCDNILTILENHYNVSINKNKKQTLASNIFFSREEAFDWPERRLGEGDIFQGNCLALKDHIAILVDGTIVPCCLDNEGYISLGNIFHDDLEKVINSSKYINMIKAFQENKRIYPLCQSCNFYVKTK